MRSIVKCKQRMITLIILILAIILCVCSIVFTTEQEVALAEENYFTGHSSLSFANKKESISYQTAGGAPQSVKISAEPTQKAAAEKTRRIVSKFLMSRHKKEKDRKDTGTKKGSLIYDFSI